MSFLFAPQWQGSGSSRALQLRDGAEALREDLPSASTTDVAVPLGAGESLGSGVRRFSAIQSVQERIRQILPDLESPVITIGGDCGVDLAPIAHAHAAHPNDLALVWFDAHADLHTPNSSPSGAFHGMVLRTLLGDGFASLVPDNPIPEASVVLAGNRALDEPEARWVSRRGIRMLAPAETTPEALVEAVRQTGARAVYLHIDLDALDPAEFSSLSYPEPFGLATQVLLGSIRALRAHFELAGASLCEFAPTTPDMASDDLPTILRIIAALTAPAKNPST